MDGRNTSRRGEPRPNAQAGAGRWETKLAPQSDEKRLGKCEPSSTVIAIHLKPKVICQRPMKYRKKTPSPLDLRIEGKGCGFAFHFFPETPAHHLAKIVHHWVCDKAYGAQPFLPRPDHARLA